MKLLTLSFLIMFTFSFAKAQERPAPKSGAETGEKFKLGMAGYTFVKFDLDKTLETLKRTDVRYLCI